MTRLPIVPRSRTRPVCVLIVLMLLLSALLLAAGCESDQGAPAVPTGTTAIPTPKTIPVRFVTTAIPPADTMSVEAEPVSAGTPKETAASHPETTALSTNFHPDYIRMDAVVYKVGEVVQFYLVNKGPEISGCDFSHPVYTVYHLSPDRTLLAVATHDPDRSYSTVMSGDPGSATGPFSLDTSRLSAGRYLIRFDCGNNVGREFVLLAR